MSKYKLGYTCGVFDMFHVGHLNFLEECKKHCDFLLVGICDDDYVRNIKNKEPIISENERSRIVKALKCVDDTIIVDTATTNDKTLALEKFKFDALFAGDDWKGSDRYKKTEADFKKFGNISIEYFPYTKGVSSTAIRKKIVENK